MCDGRSMIQQRLSPLEDEYELTEIQEEKLVSVWSRTTNLLKELFYVDTNEPSYYILSFGGGRQTVALLFKLRKLFSNNKKAFVVFADTGGEHQETYDYINEYIIPFCRIHNIQFITVKKEGGKTLYEYCFDKKIVPSMKFRDCTTKFKIAEIRRFLRKVLKIDRNNPCFVFIGISKDEADRMNPSNVKYAISVYPLVDGFRDLVEPMTTEECEEFVQQLGFPKVPKSGCWFCPYAKVSDLLDPRYKDKTIALEENNSRFPEILLRGMKKHKVKPIRELTEDDISLSVCKSGYCMV